MAKRKAKSSSKRILKQKADYDSVLILTEGRKTEINYFRGLRNYLRLSSLNIEVLDVKQTTPDSLFNKAKELYQKSKKDGNPYDRVYCVFDKDRHLRYKETKDNIKQTKNFYTTYSEPCFEYWLLLHYVNTTKPFINWDELKKDKKFRQCFLNYEKSEDIFDSLKDRIDIACKNAKNNPYTNVNELVIYLQNIKKNQ